MTQSGNGWFLGRIILLASAYCVSGWLGLLMAVPPGYATIIWPPSGLAMGVLFIFGWRLWPGILLGSFLLNGYISGAYAGDTGLDTAKTLTALAIAAGSSLQALVGYALVKRFLGLPFNFERIREVVFLFVLAGPVACIVAATIGVSTLHASGIVQTDQILANWLTWWTGDVFGVLVFLPLVLLAPGMPHRLTWRGKVMGNLPVTALLVLLIPLGLTFYTWKISSEASNNNGEIQFESLAVESKKALLSRINSYENALQGGVAYFQGSSQVTRPEWRRYVEMLNVESNFPGINGLGWIPSLAPSGIDSYLRTTRADGVRNFQIHPKDVAEGNYIITYIEPEKTNRQALGLNIAFEANRKQAADLARQTGKPTITKRIFLVQDEEKTAGFLLLHPMFREGFEPGSSGERDAIFDGWIYAPFIAKKFMKDLTQSQGNTINLRIYDGTSEHPDALIYNSNTLTDDQYVPTFSRREQIDVMQQKWFVVWESTPGFEQVRRSNNPILILAGGLLITFLLALFLFVANIRGSTAVDSRLGRKAMILPGIVFGVLAMGSMSLYWTLNNKELSYLKTLISSETNKIDSLIEAETGGKISALKRMASRMERNANQPLQNWQIDASNYIDDLSGLRAIGWVNSANIMLHAQQSPRNHRLIWIDTVLASSQAELVQQAVAQDAPKLSPPIKLTDTESAFVTYFPLRKMGVPDGYLAAVFSVREFFSSDILPETLERYRFVISHDDEAQVEFGNSVEPMAANWMLEAGIQILDRKWTVRAIPTEPFLQSQRSSLPDTVLVAGFLISLLAALTAYMTLLSRLKSTDLERSNRLIKRESTRNSTVMNTVLDGVLTFNADGIIESINPAGLRLFGYEPGDVVGRNVKMLMPNPEAYDRHLEDYLTTGASWVIGVGRQVSSKHRDGSIFPTDLSVNEMNLDGQRMFVATVRDTSEAVAAAQALSESNALQSAVLASTAFMIIATDVDGKIVIFNEAAETALGYTAEEVVGKQTPAILHDTKEVDEKAKVLSVELGEPVSPGFKTLVKKVDKAGIDENEWTYVRKDGSRFPVLVTATALRNDGDKITGYLGVIVDITKQKEIDRLKSDFVSIVSHELRTPLTSIRGALGLVAGPMAKELPEKALRLVDIAHKNCERLTLLINDILDIDKIESGQMRFEIQPENLEQILRQAIDVNQPYAEKLGVVFKAAEIDADLRVNVDAARLAQVLANLLSNAAKFSIRGDSVEVSARRHDGRVRISVKDYGSGIVESFRPQIFGKFSQGDSSSTRVKGGSGLGLHISKQIIERLGGTIGFDTEVGQGTTFWFELPLPMKEYVTGPIGDADVQRSLLHYKQREAPTLLHVEDDEDLSRVLAMSLQGRIDVVTATTLKEAEQLLREKSFDLVVLDLELPDGSGLGLLKTMAELIIPPIPVVILSASEVSKDVEDRVASTMVKSRASEAAIISKIESLVLV